MLLYIIGFTGAGKSTLAKQLASSWGISAYDTDEMFCQKYRTSISAYVTKYGWPAFRERESKILLGTRDLKPGFPALGTGFEGIVACGGGIVELTQNRDFLRTRQILWLAPPWENLMQQIRMHGSAFAQGKSEAELYQEYARRLPLYRDCLR